MFPLVALTSTFANEEGGAMSVLMLSMAVAVRLELRVTLEGLTVATTGPNVETESSTAPENPPTEDSVRVELTLLPESTLKK